MTVLQMSEWFDEGVRRSAAYLIVVCDDFNHEDYPVYVQPEENFFERFDHFNGKNMQRIMEVYDLAVDKVEQFSEQRAWRVPERT